MAPLPSPTGPTRPDSWGRTSWCGCLDTHPFAAMTQQMPKREQCPQNSRDCRALGGHSQRAMYTYTTTSLSPANTSGSSPIQRAALARVLAACRPPLPGAPPPLPPTGLRNFISDNIRQIGTASAACASIITTLSHHSLLPCRIEFEEQSLEAVKHLPQATTLKQKV